jgi:hypothetical protein
VELVLEFLKKHPEMVGIAVAAVAIIAYMQSRNDAQAATTGDGGVTFTGGGVQAAPMDPNIAATDQARIAAGSQNVGILASLILGENQSNNAVTAALAQSHDALNAALASTAAGERTAVAATSASLQSQLAGIAAARDSALAQAQAAVDIAHASTQKQQQQQQQQMRRTRRMSIT